MHSSRIIISILISIFVLITSIWLGVGVASNQTQTLIISVVLMGIAICASLGQRIWLLFLFLFSMQVPIIRGFSSKELGCFILIGFSMLAFLIRRLNLHHRITELDFWRAAIALVILQVYLRNPVGLNIFGSGSVGGKPYVVAGITMAAGIILSKYKVSLIEMKWSRWVAIASVIIMFPLNSWRYGLGRGPDLAQVQSTAGFEGEGAGRDSKYEQLARISAAFVSSKLSPLRACFHFGWVWLVLFALAASAISGFRNNVAYVGIVFLIGIAYYGKFISVLISVALGSIALGALALINLTYPLPANVQRALSPFPGTWEERFVQGAENSTEWRVEMWKEALLTDNWIKNKFLGDGIGMTRDELEKSEDLKYRRKSRTISNLTPQQETMMINGSYHSGPVQTIRIVGYFGLLVILIAYVRLGVIVHTQIKRCWGTEWQSIVMFFGIPMIAYPIFFTLIFGTFQDAVANFFFYSALIDLFKNNLPLPAYVPQSRKVYTPLTWRNRAKPSPDPIPAFSSKN